MSCLKQKRYMIAGWFEEIVGISISFDFFSYGF